MTVVINGTTGISGVDGSAGTPAVQGSDTNTGVFYPAADTVAISTGGSERMRVDTSGNVGIGTSSPATLLHVSSATGSATPTPTEIRVATTTSATDWSTTSPWGRLSFYSADLTDTGPKIQGALDFVSDTSGGGRGSIVFSSAAATTGTLTERMRIDSSGNLLVGKTAPDNSERLGVKSSGNTSSTYGMRVDNSSATAMFLVRDDGYLRSPTTYNLTGGTANLSIDASGFITRATSSLRYKKDIINYDKGIAVVNQLRPVYYKSSVAGADGNIPDTQFAGMIAEELDALGLTEFVEYGSDNQVEAIRYGNMVAILTKAIQELKSIIDTQASTITALTARITALENK